MFMVRLNDYASYMLISIVWLILELVLTRYGQYSGMALLGVVINVISMVIASYRPAYSKYLFMLNSALLTVMGFLIPTSTLIIPYVIALTISITLYLLMIGALEPYPLILSLLIIYLSYILGRIIIKASILNALTPLIREVSINTDLFTVLFTWYLSLFIISIIIVLLIIYLSRKALTSGNTY